MVYDLEDTLNPDADRQLDEADDDVGRVTVRDNGRRPAKYAQLLITIPKAVEGEAELTAGDDVLVGAVDEGEALRIEPAADSGDE